MNQSKIQATHLQRRAYVYVRQSTPHQVEHHLESQQRQYELTRVAGELGYAEQRIVVIDEDLGVSASGKHERSGFERLVADVALGHAGIVLGLEVSRLARNNRDWYELLDLCAMKETLIGDCEGIYDPSSYNDRLLLGLKGTMSEAELHLIKGRMLAGLRHKAQKGELRFRLPAGYEYDELGSITKTNDEEVVHFVELVFAKFFEIGSVSGLTKYLFHEGILIPRRERSDGSIRWERAYYRALYLMIINPIYSGTYAWGRSKFSSEMRADGRRTSRRRVKPIEDWDVVLRDHHPAYISWENYERILRMMEQNRPVYLNQASQALREGQALLQGIVRCGRCGRSMTVRYAGRSGARSAPRYVCVAADQQNGTGLCQAMGGQRIDEAVSRLFLETLSGGQIELHLATLRKLDAVEDATLRQLELQKERAEYEAGRLERQYNAVEPENRLVARTLETRWNEALEKVEEVNRQITERECQVLTPLTPEEERQIVDLTRDLPRLWGHECVRDKDRKALIRSVLDEVQLKKDEREVALKLVWKGGAATEASVTLPRVPRNPPTPPDLVALVRELASRHSDAQIARIFNRRGIKTPRELPFTAQRVCDLRRRYTIPSCPERRPDEETTSYTVEQAAKLFNVSPPTIYSWLKLGILIGEQLTRGAPWSIRITERDKERLTGQAPKGWLSVNEASQDLGVTKQTILNWVKDGKVPYVYETRGRRRGLKIDVKSAPQRRQGKLLD